MPRLSLFGHRPIDAAVNLEETKARRLDATLGDYLNELRSSGEDQAAVTLAYTHSLHQLWRPALRMQPVASESSVLDVGSGLGILAFELAANVSVHVEGVDLDRAFVGHAETLHDRLAAAGLFADGARVRFSVGDVAALDFADESFDLVFVRELFQFLADPVQATGELFRVLRPGQYVCISDMDDQLRVTWPPSSPALNRLVGAVADVQWASGGDRHAGRKLTSYLRSAGFEINSLVVLSEAQHRVVDAGDAERALIIEQLHAARSRVLEAGAMQAESFDSDLEALEQEPPFEEFRTSARIVVLGQRPA
jgi:ubiquinone/menaquinone biosynthesis C-methylase UbiE